MSLRTRKCLNTPPHTHTHCAYRYWHCNGGRIPMGLSFWMCQMMASLWVSNSTPKAAAWIFKLSTMRHHRTTHAALKSSTVRILVFSSLQDYPPASFTSSVFSILYHFLTSRLEWTLLIDYLTPTPREKKRCHKAWQPQQPYRVVQSDYVRNWRGSHSWLRRAVLRRTLPDRAVHLDRSIRHCKNSTFFKIFLHYLVLLLLPLSLLSIFLFLFLPSSFHPPSSFFQTHIVFIYERLNFPRWHGLHNDELNTLKRNDPDIPKTGLASWSQ